MLRAEEQKTRRSTLAQGVATGAEHRGPVDVRTDHAFVQTIVLHIEAAVVNACTFRFFGQRRECLGRVRRNHTRQARALLHI